ncbi:endomucin isoform X2 [Mesocricetus auratus]|uniref:Endomucin isoform X2 n=1 Tax=Mesocricetus auratus TaxID=10036 RepID=A0A1U8CD39_MESAU|nr:endomucin isoform X2 [Mesocricetus auratus]
MQLLQVTALFFLLSSRVCRSEDSEDVQSKVTPSLPETSSTKSSVTTSAIVSGTNLVNKTTAGTPPKGTTDGELPKSPLTQTLTSLTTVKREETTTPGTIKNQVLTMNMTVPSLPTSNAVSTLPSSQHKTENQSSIKTTEMSVTTQLPEALSKTIVSPSALLTTAKIISKLQDTEDGKIPATPSTTPSYSSIILPVVIALIVITLLVFTLVGLYRMCWKRDPGTPESGNDQPQSDKESVKLLTVKTISHESGEHSAQGKTKN